MADVNAKIGVQIDTSNALTQLKALQKQISSFHTSIAKSSQAAAIAQKSLQANLINSINSTGQFAAGMRTIRSSAEQFTHALEKNKLSMREYMRYSAASTKTFGRFFRSEFETLNKVARERVKTLQTQYIKMGRDANGALKSIAVRPLALDMNNLATQTQLAAQKQAVLNQLLKQGSTNLLNFGKNTQWAGRQLMVGFTVPLMYLGGMAAKVFMDLEKEAIRFKRVYGEMFTTPEETNKMTEDILRLADTFTKYGIAVKDTMKMAADAAATGKMGADLMAQVTEATRLAVLGYVEQEEALKTVISLTDAFAIASEDLAKKTDFLNAVENQTILSIEDLTVAIPKAGPVVKQLGGSVEDLAFFMTAMKEGGINASEGANALKSGLASLINPTEKAAEMLGSMGINMKDIVERNAGDLKSTVLEFAYALDALKPLERSRAIEQLFGKFQFARLSTLFKNVIAEGTQSERVLQLTKATAEELAILSERELKTTEESSMYKFKKAVEDLKKSLVPLGEAFLKAVTPVVEFFRKMFDRFNEFGDGTKTAIVAITTVIAGIGPVALMTFGLLANGIANIIKLGIVLRNGYLKLTGRSKDLGTSTQYLTTEQLEAAAIANSLQQSHQNLTTQFTVERDAVLKLRDAYQQAATAAMNFAKANPGMMRPGFVPGKRGQAPRKYEDGVVSVPGPKGKGDIIPAMLTPGETVISQPLTEKYGGLLKLIATDKVPGYQDGLSQQVKGFKNATIYLPQSINDIMGKTGGPGAATGNVSQYLKGAGSAAMGPLMAVLASEIKVGLNNPKYIAEWRQAGDKFVTAAVTALESSGKKFVTDSDFEEIVVPAMKRAAGEVSIAGKNLGAAFDRAASEVRTIGPVGVASGTADPTAGRSGFAGSYRSKRSVAQRFAISTNPEYFQQQTRMSSSGRMKRYFKTLNPATGSFETGAMSHITKSITTSVSKLESMMKPYLGKVGKIIVERISKETSQSINRASKAASPSKETMRAGKNIADGAIIGIKDGTDDALKAGKQVSTAAVAGMSQADKMVRSFTTNYGNTGQPTPTDKSIRRQVEKLMKREAALQSQANKHQERINREKQKQYGHTGAISSEQRAQRRLSRSQTRAMEVAAGIARKKAAQEQAALVEAEKTKQLQQQENNERKSLWRAIFRRKTAEEKAAAVAAGGGMQGRMMGAGMVASTALMMGSMAGGTVGEISQKLMMPVMALSMLAPMLTGPWGILIAATIAVGGVLWKINSDFNNARKEGIRLANSMSMTSDQLDKFAKTTGTVGATELANRQRQQLLTGATAVQRKTGQTLLTGEAGKSILNNIETLKAAGKTSDEIARSISNSLSVAITQGVLTTEQARSLAMALGEKLGNYEIPAKISGNIVSLFGLNGENLAKDPLQIRLAIQKQSMDQQAQVFRQAIQSVQEEGKSLIPAIVSGVNIFDPKQVLDLKENIIKVKEQYDLHLENKKLMAAAVQLGVQQITQNSGLVDSLNREYDTRVRNARTAKEIKEIEEERVIALEKLNTENDKTLQSIIDQKDSLDPKVFTDAINASIDALYKEGPIKVFAEKAKKDLESMKDSEFKTNIQLQFASGSMDPTTVSRLVGLASTSRDLESSYSIILKAQGSAQANSLVQLLIKSGAKDQTIEYMVNVFAQNPKEFDKNLNALSQLSNMQEKYGITVDINVDGFNKIQNVKAITDALANEKNVITKKIIADYANDPNNPQKSVFQSILDNWQTLVGSDKTITKQMILDFVAAGDQNVYRAYLTDKGVSSRGASTIGDYITQTAGGQAVAKSWLIAGGAKNETEKPKPKGDGTKDIADGAKVASSSLDSLVSKLKEVRKNQLGVTEGWAQSMAALRKMFGGKTKWTAFSGISQDLSKIKNTVGTNLLEYILGMDPQEYEAQKKKLFEFDQKGNIIGLKEDAETIKLALNSIATGEVQANILKQNTAFKEQTIALNRMMAAGISTAKAYDLLSNAQLRSAIASAKTKEEIEEIMKLLNQIKNSEYASDIEDAFKNINIKISETNLDNAAKARLKSQYSTVMQQAILSDDTLMAMFKLNQEGAEEFGTRLQQVIDSIEFKTNIFEDGFSKAMEWFSAQEEKIQIDFEVKTGADQKLIEAAENQIAGIQYQIDDYEAGLQKISEQEDEINSKYDAQIKALEDIKDLNKDIADQQKMQIDLADALSQGDISAAAKAMSAIKAQQAQKSSDEQKSALENARQVELKNISTEINGIKLTRSEIEEKIKNLQQQIFNIEEKTLEPARERVRLAEVEKNTRINELTLLGRNKLAWQDIKNSIDLARTSSSEYMNAIQAALDMVQSILDYWNNLDGKVVTTYHKVVTQHVGSGGGTGEYDPGKDPLNTELRGGNAKKIEEQLKNAGGAYKVPSAADFRKAEEALSRRIVGTTYKGSSLNRIRIDKYSDGSIVESPDPEIEIPRVDRIGRPGEMLAYAKGGIVPKYFAKGGFSKGTDTVPAMLTPGEFVVNRNSTSRNRAVLEAINSGDFAGMLGGVDATALSVPKYSISSNSMSAYSPAVSSSQVTNTNSTAVYNYNVTINSSGTNANPNGIARSVVDQIRYIDSQRIRGQ